ncbi:hypothetical protein ACJJTC_004390 [Scirpophaga incertulas]
MVMELRRKVHPGPIAPARHKDEHADANKTPQQEVISVHAATPGIEQKSLQSEKKQICYGGVNVLSIIDADRNIMCCKYTEDSKHIAIGLTDGVIGVFDCNTGKSTHTLVDEECQSYPGPVTAIKHRPVSSSHPVTNTLLASYVNGCIKCWQYKYRQCLYTIREKRQTLGLCYHRHYSKFITFGDDAKLNMYHEEAQTQERSFYSSKRKNIFDGHISRIFAVAFNPKSHHELISGGWDNAVVCWDDRQPYATRHFFGVHMCGEGLDFDKSGKQTECSIRNNPGNIYAFDFGTFRRKPRRNQETNNKISEIENIPRVSFVTGKRLQTVDFG